MLHLSIVGLAETDDADAIGRFQKTKDVNPTMKLPQGYVSDFAVFAPVIDMDKGGIEFELCSRVERQAAFADVSLVLARVEVNSPSTDCMYTKIPMQLRTCDRGLVLAANIRRLIARAAPTERGAD